MLQFLPTVGLLYRVQCTSVLLYFFFFNDTATTEIYTLHIVGSVRCVQETGINAEYMGKWYEIASFPNSFQKGCNCSTAEYELMEDYVKVTNSCNKDSINGKLETAIGKATVVEGTNNAKLKVSFFWPFKGDYWVIELADDYSYAVIGNPSRKYLWILSRTPVMKPEIYQQILKQIEAKGFDIKKLRITKQNQLCQQVFSQWSENIQQGRFFHCTYAMFGMRWCNKAVACFQNFLLISNLYLKRTANNIRSLSMKMFMDISGCIFIKLHQNHHQIIMITENFSFYSGSSCFPRDFFIRYKIS
eukprot:TRINITY_DN16720_c0_g1_i1.p1 TRINITY_DN16720_c0_g1~~TRINITY_DN16720_c0_g1_i1.p1  ORF type:complete len:302 (-),score=14.66 TRINITY_DN16720_c0_g1_i1:450-1355(-)